MAATRQPFVAIPAYHLAAGRVSRWSAGGFAVPEPYVSALRRAGVRSAVLPDDDTAPPSEVLERFDGLLLVGGGDIEPARYGAVAHPEVYGVEPDRDTLELALARQAVADRLPVLAVCRGLQVLNVALGGTLDQHLPDRSGLLAHGVPTGGPAGVHGVEVWPGSRLATACGALHVGACTSHHHQAVDRLAPGLVVTGRSSDGVVEAVETSAAAGWVLAVQWHPEVTAGEDPVQQALFDAFARRMR